MTKIAVSASGDNVATTFDFVDEIVVIEYSERKVINTRRFVLDEKYIPLRAAKLKLMNIDTLICGAISNQAVHILDHYGISVIAGISGNIECVVEELFKEKSDLSKYRLPGFSGKGCCRQKRRKRQQGRNNV